MSCLLLVGVSWIFIPHTVFNLNIGGAAWKAVRYSAAAFALALIGVHLALHLRRGNAGREDRSKRMAQ